MKKTASLIGTFALAFSIFALSGCFGEDGDKYQKKEARPRFYERLSPAQQKYWDTMNQNKKKQITKVQAEAEQYERFQQAWQAHIN